ncbi:hypothetical protein [Jeotgalibaca porci]|uniref:hypothetical protein n=1 Tax=Jeotgalibaca porci TaxID=1868793 RepID=UPI0035A16DA1
MTIKKFLPVLLIIVGLFGLIPYNAQNDKKEITIQTLSQTHVNYKDVETYTQFIEQLSSEAQETEKQRRLSNTKIELEKIAKAKAEEEKKVAEAKKAEEAKKAKQAEEERIAKEIAEEEARVAQEAEEAAVAAVVAQEEASVAQEVAAASEPANTQPVVTEDVQQAAPVQARTDGFNFNGRHFDIAWFSGSGQVPADSYIYRWSTDPSHYLVEMMGAAGGVIRELHVGSQIVIDGQRYTIFHMQSGVANDENAYYNMKDVGATLTFQTCDYQIGANGRYNLTIWYANPS